MLSGRWSDHRSPLAGILSNLSNIRGRPFAGPTVALRISQMRATNTGMTPILSADGRVQAALEPFTTGVLNG